LNILFIGDVVGRPGRTTIGHLLPELIEQYSIDFTIVNAENAAGGYGLTRNTAGELFDAGANCLTSGNHIWAQKEAYELLAEDQRILRPANYPPGVPGEGAQLYTGANQARVGVINLLVRVFMKPMDCPFRRGEEEVQLLTTQAKADVIIIDFHAEATSEKKAFGLFVDGQVAAVLGTHTHVQTADEQILAGGTAFITDCGMTGAVDTVIGVDPQAPLQHFLTGLPVRFQAPAKGPCILSGVVLKCNIQTGLAEHILRIRSPYPSPTGN